MLSHSDEGIKTSKFDNNIAVVFTTAYSISSIPGFIYFTGFKLCIPRSPIGIG